MPKKPELRVIGASLGGRPGVTPPSTLDVYGKRLWSSIMAEYAIEDSGGLELLRQACASADRAESCRLRIDAEGELIKTRTGYRDHPLLRHEAVARAFVVKTLKALNLDVEPLKAVGRPPGAKGG